MPNANRSVNIACLTAVRFYSASGDNGRHETAACRSGAKMNLRFFRPVLAAHFLAVLAGCGEDSGGIQFAATTGVVTYEGAPLSRARVMAIPEKGPLALGNTDDSGRFTLFSGARSGVAIGKIRVSVSVSVDESESNSIETPSTGRDDPANVGRARQSMAKTVEAQKNKNKKPQSSSASALAKFGDPATSDLSYEIKPGRNDLKIVLK